MPLEIAAERQAKQADKARGPLLRAASPAARRPLYPTRAGGGRTGSLWLEAAALPPTLYGREPPAAATAGREVKSCFLTLEEQSALQFHESQNHKKCGCPPYMQLPFFTVTFFLAPLASSLLSAQRGTHGGIGGSDGHKLVCISLLQ